MAWFSGYLGDNSTRWVPPEPAWTPIPPRPDISLSDLGEKAQEIMENVNWDRGGFKGDLHDCPHANRLGEKLDAEWERVRKKYEKQLENDK